MGFSVGGTRVFACFSRRTSATASVIWEEATSPLPVSCLTGGLPHIYQQHYTVEALGQGFVLIPSSSGGPTIPGSTLLLHAPQHACVDTYLPEVDPPADH